jgi:hypothetical protein
VLDCCHHRLGVGDDGGTYGGGGGSTLVIISMGSGTMVAHTGRSTRVIIGSGSGTTAACAGALAGVIACSGLGTMAWGLQGGLNDGVGFGEVDDGTDSGKLFGVKFWQPCGVSENLRALGFPMGTQ